ncbi:MAG: hypothetical protein AAF567_25130 [Actinomycetota bacterium]
MSITESQRRAIFEGLETVMGAEAADDLLSMLPHQPAAELVTRTDLFATSTQLRGEMAELRGELAELRAELKGEMAELRAELKGEMADLRTELRTEIANLRVTTQRWMSGAMATNTVALVVALVT